MPIPYYLALTAAEFSNIGQLPPKIAWMACHYSCYGTGISNLPTALPEGSVVILNDRMPPDRHDPQRIVQQLLEVAQAWNPDGILLDFQRTDLALNQEVAQLLCQALPCPVGTTAPYAKDLSCPVFLEPPPLHMPAETYWQPWQGREIWLEVAPETRLYRVTEQGCTVTDTDNAPLPEPVYPAPPYFCRYHPEISPEAAEFTLQRTKKDLDDLLEQTPGITRAIGLYQQLAEE
jgi:hypothetical protein